MRKGSRNRSTSNDDCTACHLQNSSISDGYQQWSNHEQLLVQSRISISKNSESPCIVCPFQMDWTSQQKTNDTWKQDRQRIVTLYSVMYHGGGNTWRGRRRLLTFGSKEWEKLIEDFPFEKLWKEWWKKKIDAEPNKGEPGNQNIRKFRYKNRNADGRGRILLKAILWNQIVFSLVPIFLKKYGTGMEIGLRSGRLRAIIYCLDPLYENVRHKTSRRR